MTRAKGKAVARQKAVQSPTPTRTKQAYIELFLDEGTSSICNAFDFEGYPDAEPIYQAGAGESWCPLEGEAYEKAQAEAEQQATLQVLGWLWQHGYRSAQWAEQVYGDGKPDWATKDVYVWGDKAVKP